MFLQTNRNDGLFSRVLEMKQEWTGPPGDPWLADWIASFVHRSYGTAYVKVAEFLLNTSTDELAQSYYDWRTYMAVSTMPRNSIEERATKLCAVAMVAAQVLDESLGIRIEYPELRRLLRQAFTNTVPERPFAERVHSLIVSWVVAHLDKFPREQDLKRGHSGINILGAWGKRSTSKKEGVPCVYIIADRLEKMLVKNGFPDIKRVCNELQGENRIKKYAGNRYRKNTLVGDMVVPCFCVFSPPLAEPKAAKRRKFRKPQYHGGNWKNQKRFILQEQKNNN